MPGSVHWPAEGSSPRPSTLHAGETTSHMAEPDPHNAPARTVPGVAELATVRYGMSLSYPANNNALTNRRPSQQTVIADLAAIPPAGP